MKDDGKMMLKIGYRQLFSVNCHAKAAAGACTSLYPPILPSHLLPLPGTHTGRQGFQSLSNILSMGKSEGNARPGRLTPDSADPCNSPEFKRS